MTNIRAYEYMLVRHLYFFLPIASVKCTLYTFTVIFVV
jgi:hypothetical protein